MPNAVEVIKKDHDEVRRLYNEYRMAGREERKKIAERMCRVLEVHSHIEADYFYPEYAGAGKFEDKVLVEEARSEQKMIATVLKEVERGELSPQELDGKVLAFMEEVFHRLGKEEQEMLPRAEILLDKPTLELLGAQMEKFKKAEEKQISL